eukprot:8288545-Karenia_brevis.AAC.1
MDDDGDAPMHQVAATSCPLAAPLCQEEVSTYSKGSHLAVVPGPLAAPLSQEEVSTFSESSPAAQIERGVDKVVEILPDSLGECAKDYDENVQGGDSCICELQDEISARSD